MVEKAMKNVSMSIYPISKYYGTIQACIMIIILLQNLAL